jgi:hypothetical protein
MEKDKLTGKLFFTHMEVGYTTERGDHFIPNPQWSGPSNQRTLDQLDAQVAPGVVDRAASKVVEILTRNGARGLFLVFPYFAEKHSAVLKIAIAQNHVVGIHMHENWKAVSANNTAEGIAIYLKSEKKRLDTNLGTQVTIFSYGPGLQLDTIGGKERPPDTGAMSDDEKRRLFQAVANAGFTSIQTAREYQEFLPTELGLITADLVGLPHSFEWHDTRGDLRDTIDRINDQTRSQQEQRR